LCLPPFPEDSAMTPIPADRHATLVKRILAARAALHDATDPDTRAAALEELGAATRELSELILAREGRLKSPLE
jgi:hypothetical protein